MVLGPQETSSNNTSGSLPYWSRENWLDSIQTMNDQVQINKDELRWRGRYVEGWGKENDVYKLPIYRSCGCYVSFLVNLVSWAFADKTLAGDSFGLCMPAGHACLLGQCMPAGHHRHCGWRRLYKKDRVIFCGATGIWWVGWAVATAIFYYEKLAFYIKIQRIY